MRRDCSSLTTEVWKAKEFDNNVAPWLEKAGTGAEVFKSRGKKKKDIAGVSEKVNFMF